LAALSELPGLTAAISGDLRAAGIAHAVSGAAALAAYGVVRATRDLDVLVSVPAIRLPHVFVLLRHRGFAGEDADLLAALRDRSVAEMTSAGPLSVELLVPALPYHHDLLRRAVDIEVQGVPVPFVSREDLVVLKLLWRRTKDVADVEALLAASDSSLNVAYVRRTLASLLPNGDPRLIELEALLRRFWRG
jgi:hypothetical protein